MRNIKVFLKYMEKYEKIAEKILEQEKKLAVAGEDRSYLIGIVILLGSVYALTEGFWGDSIVFNVFLIALLVGMFISVMLMITAKKKYISLKNVILSLEEEFSQVDEKLNFTIDSLNKKEVSNFIEENYNSLSEKEKAYIDYLTKELGKPQTRKDAALENLNMEEETIRIFND